MLTKRLTSFIAAALTLILLSGCTPVVPDSIDGETVSFTDALGRQVTVKKGPERVAALIGSFADVWILSGGSICAAPEDAFSDFGLNPDGVVNIGGAHSPGLESLLSAEPELVIASASTASNVEMMDALEAAGIAVIYFDVDSFDDYLSMLGICTDITGRNDLYKKNGLDIKENIDAVRSLVVGSELSDDARRVLILRASSGSVKAKGSEGTILGEMLADLGCINIADSDETLLSDLSVESIINSEPYRIFVVTMGENTEKATANLYRLLSEDPAWGTLSAVTEGRLHIMDKKLFNLKPNANWAVSYEILSEILLSETK